MEGPKNTNRFPLISHARVIGYDAQNHSVLVTLPSIQGISIPVRLLYNGPADATRIEQQSLPILGTWGLVVFPFGLVESATWLGSIYPTGVTAINSSTPPTDQDGQMKYMSHASGSWSLLDYVGQYTMTFGDNTQILVNSTNTTPPTFRRALNSDGNLVSIPYYQSDRNPNPAPPFWISITHPGSGASATISPSGDVTILGGGPLGTTTANFNLANDGTATVQGGNGVGASLVIQPNGITTIQTGGNPGAVGSGIQTGPTIVLNPQIGSITITGANGKSSVVTDVNGAVTVTAANGNSHISMDKDGNITIQSSTEQITVEAKQQLNLISDNNDIIVQAKNGDIVLETDINTTSIDQIIAIFNAHVHGSVQSGSSDTGPPTTDIP